MLFANTWMQSRLAATDAQPGSQAILTHWVRADEERLAMALQAAARGISTRMELTASHDLSRWIVVIEATQEDASWLSLVPAQAPPPSDLDGADLRRRALAELSTMLRDVNDMAEVAYRAAEILGRTLGVSRAGYGTIDPVTETITIERDWNAPGIHTLAGVLHFREYGTYIEDLKRGTTVVCANAYEDARTAATADALRAISAVSFVNMPVTEHGGFVALLYLNHEHARRWLPEEIALMREFANRTRVAVERRRAEQELQALASSLELQVEERTAERDRMWRLSSDIMVVADVRTHLLAVSPAWTAILGWTEKETIGRSYLDFVHPEDMPRTEVETDHLAGGDATLRFENRYRCVDGSYRHLSWRAVPSDGIIHAVARDVTADRERQDALLNAQEQLRQAQKMESIGKLTGGVAHDFNNLLQVISGNLQLLASDIAGNERAERRVANAMAGVTRGSKLASQLLAFGRRQPLAPKVVNIGRFVREIDDLLRRALGEAVEVETVIAGGLWNTLVDPTNVENALLNLTINARDAMEGRGRLTIEAGNALLDESYAQAHGDVRAGQYVMLAVSDTGSGIPADIIDRVFDPFFTTKPEGRGTGLGLSMVYGFVKQSGGHIKIYSEPGQGTTVKLYLPRSTQSEDRQVALDEGEVRGGDETILVAEDDDAVRDIVVGLLTELGYRVLKSRDAQSALSIIESGMAIDVLFTDVVMPGPLKSPELARKAVERIPDLCVLFTSGYTENSIVHGGRLDEGIDLLSKPYSREALARKIRSVLANRRRRMVPAHHAASEASESVTPVIPAVPASLRILVCEDDALIRMSIVEMLESKGHRVFEAADGEEAVRVHQTHRIDVLLADVSLPGMSGVELAQELRRIQPGLPVVFATGDRMVDGMVDDGRTAVIGKPYGANDLMAAVSRVLTGSATA
ncbi:PAS domain S-box-containing protein [Luteibacter sp. Sphag1AF]|uniref:hybrid sensor histidine kinase/response regulator n=1 Tax=Luteibacter sp. Sphag1AF TaxID=2587031 RepID=UPI001620BB06|nr:response regulator [Luteibacter sp. Sphag1AF]MBB3227961.1 PAS domain S-box-containing protein [Luteibacter sp. Sphag1AF]